MTDNESFYHWVKAEIDYLDYPYSKFNTKIDVVTYSDDEYEQVLKRDDWSRSETDHLMYLCLKYDLRWPVIVDRYTLTPPRTTEHLQERYYGIVSKIKALRAGATEAQMTNEAYTKFDVSFQKARRTQLELMLRKLKGDEEEEAALKEELKNIDAELKRKRSISKKDKTAVKDEAVAVDGTNGSSGNVPFQNANSRRVGSGLIIPFSSIDDNSSSSSSSSSNNNNISNSEHDGSNSRKQGAIELPSAGNPRLQSSRLVPLEFTQDIAKSLTKKMSLLLNELGMPENPLPTRAVCDLVDAVRKETATLLSIQNVLHKKDSEIVNTKAATAAQINDYVAAVNQSNTNNATISGPRVDPKSCGMPMLMTSGDAEILIPQSMLTNSEYVAAPEPPIKEKAPIPSNTKKPTSTSKRKSIDSSGVGDNNELLPVANDGTPSGATGGHTQDAASSQPATKKSKKS